jgi:hypothetical protein
MLLESQNFVLELMSTGVFRDFEAEMVVRGLVVVMCPHHGCRMLKYGSEVLACCHAFRPSASFWHCLQHKRCGDERSVICTGVICGRVGCCDKDDDVD